MCIVDELAFVCTDRSSPHVQSIHVKQYLRCGCRASLGHSLTDDVLVQAAAEPACLQCVQMELSHWAALIGAAEVLLLRANSLEIILQEVR